MIFLLALIARAYAPADFWTADEAKHWSVRVDAFWLAVLQGDYAKTNLVGHPGVTTMWLGTLGILVQQGLERLGWIPVGDPALYRFFLRLPFMVVTSLCIAASYPLLRRLFDRQFALLTTLFWIYDPFLVAHSKVIHVDALLTSFLLVAMLAALVAFGFEHASPFASQPLRVCPRMFTISAGAAALALLTKSPSLIIFPMFALIAFIGLARQSGYPGVVRRSGWYGLSQLLKQWFVLVTSWTMLIAAMWVALWPAAWIDPLGSVQTVLNEVLQNGGKPHGWGNFFLGRVFQDEGPGWLYYPVAIVLRLTPWATIGLLLAGIIVLARMIHTLWLQPPTSPLRDRFSALWTMPSLTGHQTPACTCLLIFAIGFCWLMSIPPKKFDRYVLPIFPILDLIAALGLLRAAEQLGRWLTPRVSELRWRNVIASMGWILLIGGMVVNLAWYHPYEIAYYNPLVGGGEQAVRTILVGWGEGLEQAGKYITQQYNGCDLGIASWYEDVLQPYVCSKVIHLGYLTVPGHVHYGVLYINQTQRNIRSDILPYIQRYGALVHTVRIHGITYAQVYQLRQPRQHETAVDFGPSIRLTGYDIATDALLSSRVITITTQWQARQLIGRDYALFVHVFNEQGQLIGQTDTPPGGPAQPTKSWGINRFIDWAHPVPIWGRATRTLFITIGLYDPVTLERLPIMGESGGQGPDDGANALHLPPVLLPISD